MRHAKKQKKLTQKDADTVLNLLDQGETLEALSEAEKIIKKFPTSDFGWKAMGAILRLLGKRKEALHAMKKAVTLAPNDTESYKNLGVVLQELGQLEEAKEYYLKAIELKPDHAEVFCNLGMIFHISGALTEAESYYTKAIAFKDDFAVAYNNLACTLKELGKLDEAKVYLLNAIKIQPDYADAYSNLGNILSDLGNLQEAEKYYLKAIDINPNYMEAYSNYLFSYNYNTAFKNSFYLEFAKTFGDIISSKVVHRYEQFDAAKSNERLRVGFVSGDFKNHAVGHFLENMLSNITSLDLFAYSANYVEDDLTQRIKPYFKQYTSIYGKNDEETAEIIYNDNINILIDLSGHSEHNRLALFAHKPSPVQASWLGYFASTGVNEIDYFIADHYVASSQEDDNFREKIYRLPHSWLCFTKPNYELTINTLPAIENGFITFGCFNNLNKLNDDVIALWSELLLKIPDAKLFLKAKQLNDSVVRESLCKKFEAHGVDSNRLVLEGQSSRVHYLESYNKIDIALDPFPYNGGTVSVEALYMGVPVLTLKGDRFLSRIGESIAYNVKMDHWIANNKVDYIEKALDFSSDQNFLADMRSKLRDRVLDSPLFDGKRFAEDFEDAMTGMWDKYIEVDLTMKNQKKILKD